MSRSFTNYSYTFTKKYRKIYIVLVGGRYNTDVDSKVVSLSLSNNAEVIVDYDQRQLDTVSTITLETRAYVAHVNNEVPAGTILNFGLASNAWYHRTLMIFGDPIGGDEVEKRYFTLGVEVSSTYSTTYIADYSYDGKPSTKWLAANTDTAPYIVFTFGEPFILKRLIGLFCNSTSYSKSGYKITVSGSNNKSDWIQIDTINDLTFINSGISGSGTVYNCPINNNKEYKYYKLSFNQANAGVTDVEFWGN